MKKETTKFSDKNYLLENPFSRLSQISSCLSSSDSDSISEGREMLIRSLEFSEIFSGYEEIIDALIRKAGLFPYLIDIKEKFSSTSFADLVEYEFHCPQGLEDIVLTTAQLNVYHTLIEGQNVILSAPTSFGKSLLIDALIATNKFSNVVIIVPTIALLDETRRRLSQRFHREYKIISHESQELSRKNIFVFTQERFLNFKNYVKVDFFVIDEFYKISPSVLYDDSSERTYVLNHAFYKLLKSGSQFFLIGPNIQDVNIPSPALTFKFIRTDFSTVATEIEYVELGTKSLLDNTVLLCQKLYEPTLIFCKSKNSAYDLGKALSNNCSEANDKYSQYYSDFIEWLENNFDKEWVVVDLLKHGIAVHHAGLPRAVSHHLLRFFNEGKIRFLLCTSTIIEGVNTVAKNIIIYDNRIATRKFDFFTFNNIKGRAGRMFQHYVGRVFILNDPPQELLPLVDFPAISQPDSTPTSLLVQMDDHDLSEHSVEKLRYLHAQDFLPVDVLQKNIGVSPELQIQTAKMIYSDLNSYHPLLSWRGYPDYKQLEETCRLIFELMGGRTGRDVVSYKHLTLLINQLSHSKDSIASFVQSVYLNSQQYTPKTISESIEFVYSFLRNWCEFSVPKFMSALDEIQKHVFEKNHLKTGDYSIYTQKVKQWFQPLSATVLEEYGLPYQVSNKIEKHRSLGDDVDSVLQNLCNYDFSRLNLTAFEKNCIDYVIKNMNLDIV